MLELDTLAKYLKHLGVRPSLNEIIDVGKLEPIQFSHVDFEPFRHRVYFALNSDDNWEGRVFNLLGYESAKAALNMATVLFAYELRNTAIKTNSANPGLIATDLEGAKAGQPGFGTPEEGTRIIVKLATLPPPMHQRGGFFDYKLGNLPW